MFDEQAASFQVHPPKRSLPALVYTLAATLVSFLTTISVDHTRPWVQRTRTINRFNRVLQQLLALTTRMHPRKLGQAAFTQLRPRPESPAQPPSQHPNPALTKPAAAAASRQKSPRRLFSARQVAARVATLLRELQVIAQETGTPLPQKIKALCARLLTKAGCPALPPRHHTGLGFFAEIMVLPPWHPLRL